MGCEMKKELKVLVGKQTDGSKHVSTWSPSSVIMNLVPGVSVCNCSMTRVLNHKDRHLYF